MREKIEPNTSPTLTRRHALECMAWAGTGILWTVSGGIPRSLGLLDTAEAAEVSRSAMTFLQISDSHLGFDKEARVTAVDTLTEAIGNAGRKKKPTSSLAYEWGRAGGWTCAGRY